MESPVLSPIRPSRQVPNVPSRGIGVRASESENRAMLRGAPGRSDDVGQVAFRSLDAATMAELTIPNLSVPACPKVENERENQRDQNRGCDGDEATPVLAG